MLKENESATKSAIATDIRHIYFNTIPDVNATLEHNESSFTFSDENGLDTHYTFSGEDVNLVEKKIDPGWFSAATKVFYFNYKNYSGFNFPTGIVLDNNKFRYRLIIKTKSVTVNPQTTNGSSPNI